MVQEPIQTRNLGQHKASAGQDDIKFSVDTFCSMRNIPFHSLLILLDTNFRCIHIYNTYSANILQRVCGAGRTGIKVWLLYGKGDGWSIGSAADEGGGQTNWRAGQDDTQRGMRKMMAYQGTYFARFCSINTAAHYQGYFGLLIISAGAWSSLVF